MRDEDEFVRALVALHVPRREDDGVALGIGDDAAVLHAGEAPLVLSVDACVEGTHFRRAFFAHIDGTIDLAAIAARAVHAAASDLAAMGASPVGLLSSLTLPPEWMPHVRAFAEGTEAAARACGLRVLGGNLARGERCAVHTTVVGRAARPVRRDGARVGDRVYLTGPTGSAPLGLELLLRGHPDPVCERWRAPRARVDLARDIGQVASAAIDISDGLLRDLGRLCEASGVGANIASESLPTHDDARTAAYVHGLDLGALSLRGGESYELVFTAPEPPYFPCHAIGVIEQAPGVRVDGAAVEVGGYDHTAPAS